MKYAIVYWSRYGNGKKIVDHLAEKLKENKAEIQILRTDDGDSTSLPESDVYIFSSPTEAFNIQKNMRTFMKNLEGMRLNKMEKLLSNKKMVKIAEVDFQVGKDANTGNGLMEGWKVKLDEFAGKL